MNQWTRALVAASLCTAGSSRSTRGGGIRRLCTRGGGICRLCRGAAHFKPLPRASAHTDSGVAPRLTLWAAAAGVLPGRPHAAQAPAAAGTAASGHQLPSPHPPPTSPAPVALLVVGTAAAIVAAAALPGSLGAAEVDAAAYAAAAASPPAFDPLQLSSSMNQLSLIPYLAFLFCLYRSKQAPPLVLAGFTTTLLFVAVAIPAGIYCKQQYGTSLANVDWLHGSCEALLTTANLLVVLGMRGALREAADKRRQLQQQGEKAGGEGGGGGAAAGVASSDL